MDKKSLVPYDRRNPVIYDNDAHADVYTDELLLALASAGEINLRGFITTIPENLYESPESYEFDYAARSEIIEKAGRSGMKNLPRHFKGPSVTLKQPASGKIEDTAIINTPGSRLIVEEAAGAAPDLPLVLIMGGPLTVAADAYLMDPAIAGRVVIAWAGGTTKDLNEYNGGVDPWADYIVLHRLRMVIFPFGDSAAGFPSVPKNRLAELPDSEFRQWMVDKRLPHVNLPNEYDFDSKPVISLLSPAYVSGIQPVAFSHWIEGFMGKVPGIREDCSSKVLMAMETSQEIADAVWWNALKNPDVWSETAVWECPRQRPFFACPFPIGKIARIEAEDYDLGGNGIAYHTKSFGQGDFVYRNDGVKIEAVQDIPGGYNVGAGGGFCVAELYAEDWLAYTVDVDKAGTYAVSARISSQDSGGFFHIEFNGHDVTGRVEIPCGGDTEWQTVIIRDAVLTQGKQVMRFIVDQAGKQGQPVKLNFIDIK